MLSTLTNYRLYSNDIAKSVARVQANATVKRDETYYKDNIGKVKSVDDFLSDQRLYTYALKAYGLADQASSKGFIRKVIESDLTDSSSFVNKLSDARYRDFATAFNFKAGATKPVAQSVGQTESLVEAYSERSIRGSVVAAQKTNYFADQMTKITSIDQLMADPTLYDVILNAADLDPTTTSKSFVEGVFRQFAGVTPQPGLTALANIAIRFNFQASDGTVPSSTPATPALSAADAQLVNYAYFNNTGNTAGAAYAAHLSAYYDTAIQNVSDAATITNDIRLFEYVTTAYGFDPSVEMPSYILSILKSDPNDQTSALGSLSEATSAERARKGLLTDLNAAFNFATTGALKPSSTAQDADQLKATKDAYYNNYKTISEKKDASAVSTFKLTIAKAKSLSDLMAFDPAFGRDALNVALRAFDIDPATTSLTQIRAVLQSDASDPKSYVNKLGDERFVKLAAAFNFDSEGKLRTERLVQSISAQAATGTLYAGTFQKPSTEQKTQITADTKAYVEGMADIDTLDQLLKSGKTLDFALKAYGLDKEKLDATKLRKIFTSDLGDPKSYVYTLKDKRYEKLAAAFNFLPSGAVRLETTGIQSEGKRLSTQNLYLLQTLEEQVGEQSEGTRLALYFLRKSPDIKSTLSLLADKALLEVTKTALGLPDSLSQVSIEAQVKAIEKKLKVADLQDKGKLDRFVARFAALYDLKNNSGANSPVMGLFAQETDSLTSLIGRF
ncbi:MULTISPECIES: DUF1217 domain-containing protein [unclassified Aureimonas]|uniref:DUF1217 domain-containing protein n=1 Tax=unclassified Aureimonas TaxID=2615206 RepID=UPI0006FE19B0|nr:MULTISPECIES: DUF1217 domain-containing protein [unclassified Aureimonas]KQT66097.1 hypothetical protein ASG62_20000 [Aureimonas sp. Leaf427]KQT81039.1 hypothetical protein ASG54_06250 [Aureimonas sp. Leaf460]